MIHPGEGLNLPSPGNQAGINTPAGKENPWQAEMVSGVF